jgi:hypothetical protein
MGALKIIINELPPNFNNWLQFYLIAQAENKGNYEPERIVYFSDHRYEIDMEFIKAKCFDLVKDLIHWDDIEVLMRSVQRHDNKGEEVFSKIMGIRMLLRYCNAPL